MSLAQISDGDVRNDPGNARSMRATDRVNYDRPPSISASAVGVGQPQCSRTLVRFQAPTNHRPGP